MTLTVYLSLEFVENCSFLLKDRVDFLRHLHDFLVEFCAFGGTLGLFVLFVN